MGILRLTRAIIMISGCFRPRSWTSPFKRAVYNVYRFYASGILFTFVFMQFMDIVLNVDNADDFTDDMYIMLTVFAAFYRTIIMWMNYEKMAWMINCINEEPFKPLDPNEMKIQQKFNRIIQNNTLRYATVIGVSCVINLGMSFFTDFRNRRLKYRGWIPYDYSFYPAFCFAYFHQILSALHCTIVNIACDSFFCALLMHVCCQFEILGYRLKMVSCNRDIMSYCVQHHNRIFKYAQLLNVRFTQIIGFQFVASTLIICSCLFKIANSKTLDSDGVSLFMYVICMMIQIFIYCWFGDKVKLKSLQLLDDIYETQWPELNNDIKKNFLIIMKRSEMPIEISTAYVVPINLESFITLLKTSYSAYSLLIRMQE